MNDVMPGILQRLRAADIIRMAGLQVASLGQEYARKGAVRATKRQGARLLGIVDSLRVAREAGAAATKPEETEQTYYSVEVELQNVNAWLVTCTCRPSVLPLPVPAAPGTLCQHAAALLYQWLAHPATFAIAASTTSVATYADALVSTFAAESTAREQESEENKTGIIAKVSPQNAPGDAGIVGARGLMPHNAQFTQRTAELLGQLGLSDLRMIAREYDVVANGMNRQQLADAILDGLRQPDAVRRVAATLEKLPRQLLATITLAGGFLTDEDLRGLVERFSIGQVERVQNLLTALQSKGLLLRAGFSALTLPRLGGTATEGGWYVPAEVRAALRVTVPVSAFDVEKSAQAEALELREAAPYRLLSDLLLIARALNGYRLEREDEKDERIVALRSVEAATTLRPTGPLASSGSPLPAPAGQLSPPLQAVLQSTVPGSPAFLRFAVRLLRLAGILHRDESGTPYLRVLPDAAQLLFGPNRSQVARDLFELWLTHPNYEELFELRDEGLLLRCRTTALNHPVLRPGELESENSEARQWLVGVLAQAPLNRWINFSAFARFIYRLNPWFLQRRQRLYAAPHWWIEQEEGQALQPTQANDWLLAEGRYLARLLQGPLHWWGICDLALSPNGRLMAFRLTPLAAWLLHGVPAGARVEVRESRESEASEEMEGNGEVWEDEEAISVGETGDESEGTAARDYSLIEVSETGDILLRCEAEAWPFIQLVETFAEVVGVRSGRLYYRLSPKALSAAMSRGQQPGVLLKLLRDVAAWQKRAGHEDTPLARLIERLERRVGNYGHVRLYSDAALLEVADGLVLRELQATTSVDAQVVRALSPTLLLLRKQGAERITEDLRRRGQTPLLHDAGEWGGDGAE
ncbi:MAG TPA: hypothetical protein VKV40_01200 [Ktedonobacteraceae bacterium]|nr:hypothetical protein [Ktedonobacteraceae bacterium]